MSLLLAALLSQAPASSPRDEAPLVSEVELRLNAGGDPKAIENAPGLILVHKGQRLSVRAVRRSIERLMETGKLADVEVIAEPTAEGLRVIFEVQARQSIGIVYVEGRHRLTESEVIGVTKLQRDSEYYPERLTQARDAVLQLYHRRGYRDVKVDVKAAEGEEGIDVGFFVDEGLPTRLKGVVVAGDPGLPMPRLLHELGLELDQVLDLANVEAALDRLRETLRAEHFYRSRVDPPQVEEGGLLVLPISAGPRIELGFYGNYAFASHALLSVLAWDGSELLDRTVAERLAQKLTNFYRYRGFHEVRVTVRDRPGAEPRTTVVGFEISEGPRLAVRAVEFKGNRGISAAELGSVLTDEMRATAPDPGTEVHALSDPLRLEGRMKDPDYSELPDPAPETVLVESAYLDAAKAMTQRYHERGYLSATVHLEQIDLSQKGATVSFLVEEGPRAILKRVDMVGFPGDFSKPSILKEGDAFGEQRAEDARVELARELSHQGFVYSNVETELQVANSGTEAQVAFKATLGPLVKVGKIFVKGNDRTHESVVRRELSFKEGEALDPDSFLASSRTLLGLGIFRSADVRILSPEVHDPVKDVVVEVHERQRAIADVSPLGYFYAEGPRITVDAEFPNIAGRAINVQTRLRVFAFAASGLALTHQVDVSDLNALEQFGGQGNVSVSNRGLLPFDIGARLDLVGERVFRQSYRFTRFAVSPGLDWSKAFTIPAITWTRPKLTLQLQYEAEWARVFRVPTINGATFELLRSDQERLRFLFGTFALHTIRFSPTIDLRDDGVVPRKGLLLQTAAETTFPIETRDEMGAAVPVEFIKLSGTVTVYVPVWRKVVFAVSARGGKVFPLTQGSVTPPVKRFFLGGSSSMRGFREDGLIAEDQRTELARQVNECKSLASDLGCTAAARTLLAGREVASQGGELFVLGKAELRFPAFGAFDLGIFVEAGNLWLGPVGNFSLRPVAGSGLRYVTPIGPLALDFGVNLARDALVNEPAFNVHFNIGLF
jgi:outer membrane protein assembly factor BamA